MRHRHYKSDPEPETKQNKTTINEFGLPNIVIPAEVLFHSGLSSTEKILFGIINNLSATENGCWASNRYLANFLNLKMQTISNAISILKKLGFLDVIITQRSDGMQVRRIFIDKNYLKKHEKILIEAYKNINRETILKKSKTPIKKIKDPYKKTLNNIDIEIGKKIDSNSIINNTYVSSKHNDIIISIINFWNDLPNTVTHSNTKTKTYKTIYLQIENLLCGLPLIKKKDDSPTEPFLDFVEEKNISRKLYLKEWTESEIKEIFQKINNNVNDDIKNDDLQKLSLPQVFWNAFAKKRGGGFSLFLHVANNVNFSVSQKNIVSLLVRITRKRLSLPEKISWGQQIQKFLDEEKITENELVEALDWYKKHKDEKYIPIIDSPQELREKYTRLKAAIKRTGNQTPQPEDNDLSPAGFPLITHPYPKIRVLSEDRTCHITKSSLEDWQGLIEGYANQLLNANIWNPGFRPNKIIVFKGVVSMQEWLDKVDYDFDGGANLKNRIKPLDELINYYILSINDWWGGWMDGVKDNVFDVNSKIFKMFIREMETSFALPTQINSEGWVNDSDWVPRD